MPKAEVVVLDRRLQPSPMPQMTRPDPALAEDQEPLRDYARAYGGLQQDYTYPVRP